MKGQFQWKATLPINASALRVWKIVDDISLIPQYHPEVRKVDFLSGQTKRAVGVKYRCNIPEGRKGTCVEEVVEHIPYQKMTVAFPEDSWGISKMFGNFEVETKVIPQGDSSSFLQLEAYYDPIGWITKILNVIVIRLTMKKRALKTIEGIKHLAEIDETPIFNAGNSGIN